MQSSKWAKNIATPSFVVVPQKYPAGYVPAAY